MEAYITNSICNKKVLKWRCRTNAQVNYSYNYTHTYSFFSLCGELHIDRMHTKYCRRCPHHIKKSRRPALDRASVIRWTAFRKLYLFPSSGVAVPAYLGPLVQIASDICVSCTDVCSYRSPSLSIFLFKRVGSVIQIDIGGWL